MKRLSIVPFTSYQDSVRSALDKIKSREELSKQRAIIIKPNLINASPPPVTTPVECVKAVIQYVRSCSDAEIVIAEGCGAIEYDTDNAFKHLGYSDLSEEMDVPLVDLNYSETVFLQNKVCKIFKEMHLPKIAMDSYIISVPVLKAHSLADITGTMKNMIGLAPPRHYQINGHWKKSAFHKCMHDTISDLMEYRSPDLSVMDARIGLADYHLGGRECDPPVNKIIAGFDAREVDRTAAKMLGLNWRDIPHLA